MAAGQALRWLAAAGKRPTIGAGGRNRTVGRSRTSGGNPGPL